MRPSPKPLSLLRVFRELVGFFARELKLPPTVALERAKYRCANTGVEGASRKPVLFREIFILDFM